MVRTNMRTFLAFATVAVGCNGAAAAFTAQQSVANKMGKKDLLVMSLSPVEEQQAAAMSEYLVKAHEDKLRAVQEVEKKKQGEIDELQSQLLELKGQQQLPPAASAMVTASAGNLADLSKEQLVNKLISYQEFMSKYIVESQEQKMKAVKAAEESVAKKFEGKVPIVKESAAKVVEKETLAKAPVSNENELFAKRNAQISAAAKAGKSRWGDKEVERANNSALVGAVKATKTPPPPTAKNAPTPTVVVTPEVEAADHGLRSDGSVGGLTLAERVSLGANAAAASADAAPAVSVSTLSPNTIFFQKRNANIAAAGKAGKSRWGTMEVEKATEQTALVESAGVSTPAVTVVDVPPEVVEADHGLSASGSVGGPSLAQRVNLGASLLG